MAERCLRCGREINEETVGEYHAACAKALFGSTEVPTFAYSMDDLNRLARNIIEARSSVPGVQAKLSLHLERNLSGGDRLTLVGLNGDYILKLPSTRFAELTESEHFAMWLARSCGISTAEFGLVRLANGSLAYLTRRMDRENGVKHMEDMCQLTLRRSERKYYGSYEQIAKAIRAYSDFARDDALKLFEVVLFSYVTGNSDMHLKNFSLLREHNGEWHLSPAYDLVPVKTVLPMDQDDLALTLNGKNRNLTAGDFRTAALAMRLTEVQYRRTVKRILTPLAENLETALGQSFLSENFKGRVAALIRARLREFASKALSFAAVALVGLTSVTAAGEIRLVGTETTGSTFGYEPVVAFPTNGTAGLVDWRVTDRGVEGHAQRPTNSVLVRLRFEKKEAGRRLLGETTVMHTVRDFRITRWYPELKARKSPDWFTEGVVYQLMPRLFTREGTLKAAKARLGWIRDLGVSTVYLTPTAVADDCRDPETMSRRQRALGGGSPYNPYRIMDYEHVDPEYGTDQDLKDFVAEAHRLGLRVLNDVVYMHAGPSWKLAKEHPEWLKRDPDGKVMLSAWKWPLPDFTREDVQDYFIGNLTTWVRDFGFDGFRCDVADGAPLYFWERAREALERVKPDVALIAESQQIDDYLYAFDTNYGWPVCMVGIIRTLTGECRPWEIRWRHEKTRELYLPGSRLLYFTENHDTANDSWSNRVETVYGHANQAAGLVLLLTMDGIPMLHMGQEIASSHNANMFAFHSGIDWTKDAATEAAAERLALVKELMALRKAHPALRHGELVWRDSPDRDRIVTFERRDAASGDAVRVTVNLSKEPAGGLPAWGWRVEPVGNGAKVVRIFRPARPTLGNTGVVPLQPADAARWIWGAGIGDADTFVRFRADFPSDGSAFELDVTADHRFVLFLDGREIARGPHRGEVDHWNYQTYAVSGLTPGNHRLEAVVYHGSVRPSGQLGWRGGFLVKASGAYDAHLTTGKAPWRAAELKTMEAIRGKRKPAVGAAYRVRGTSALADEPAAEAWRDTVAVSEAVLEDNNCAYRIGGWSLFPSELPDMTLTRTVPGRFVGGGADGPVRMPLTVPARTKREYLWHLGDYRCAYPRMTVRGGRGAKIRWGWAESLVGPDGKKGHRGEWKGKTFPEELPWAIWDEFLPDGRETGTFTTPWWRAGLWCLITVETADEPVTVTELALDETHYPYETAVSSFRSDDASLDAVRRLCVRGLEMCSHETYMDCPFHEQYQYPGDARIEALVAACVSGDGRLTRSAIQTFDLARRSDGIGPLHAPAADRFASVTYTLAWILMCRDHALWHADREALKARLPGIRHALAGIGYYENAAGLLENLPGWSFTDWVQEPRYGFICGIAPDGKGLSSVNNLLYLYALKAAAFVERACGSEDYAALWEKRAERLAAAIRAAFWCPDRALFADTVRKDRFSEHAQCYALLADALPPAEARRCFGALVSRGTDLAPASTYFSFYLFETYAKFGRADLIRARLEPWKNFLRLGAATPFENQDPEFRSDCHAWSAAPVYFMHAVFAGVTPSAPHFAAVRVAPQPAGLKKVHADTPTPRGVVTVDLSFPEDGSATGTVTLPDGLAGTFVWGGRELRLASGTNSVKVKGVK